MKFDIVYKYTNKNWTINLIDMLLRIISSVSLIIVLSLLKIDFGILSLVLGIFIMFWGLMIPIFAFIDSLTFEKSDSLIKIIEDKKKKKEVNKHGRKR